MGTGIDDVTRGICPVPTGIRSNESRQAIRRRVERILRTRKGAHVSDPDDAVLIALRDRLRVELTRADEWIPELQIWRYASPPTDEQLADAMVEREIDRMAQAATAAVPMAAPLDPNSLGALFNAPSLQSAGRARSDYEAFLFEMAQASEAEHEAACSRLRWPGPECTHAPTSRRPVTVDMHTYYIGPPVEALARHLGTGMPELVSLALDFVPIVGQLKGVAEAIIGKDLITGRELAAWERGLNALLALIPSAKGIFRAGKSGLQVLAQVTRKSGLPAKDVFHAVKGASELTEAQVIAAKAREPLAVEKMAGTLHEMTGTVRMPPAKTNYRIANGLIENNRSVARASADSVAMTADVAAKAEAAAKAAEAAAEAAKAATKGKTGAALKAAREQAKVAREATEAARKAANQAARTARGVETAMAKKAAEATKAQAKAATPVKTPPEALKVMTRGVGGIEMPAIEALEKAGVKVSERAAYLLVNNYAGFLNRFHRRPGFATVVADLIADPNKRKGAELVVEFVQDVKQGIDPLTVAFEVPAGITKVPGKGESVSRFTDLVATVNGKVLNHEFKAYNQLALIRWAQSDRKILQLVKDARMLGSASVRWVFGSREVSRDFVYKQLRQAIRRDPVLAREFGDASKLDAALDKLVVMYPPVPVTPPLPGLHGVAKSRQEDK